jgi:hypothetical protein
LYNAYKTITSGFINTNQTLSTTITISLTNAFGESISGETIKTINWVTSEDYNITSSLDLKFNDGISSFIRENTTIKFNDELVITSYHGAPNKIKCVATCGGTEFFSETKTLSGYSTNRTTVGAQAPITYTFAENKVPTFTIGK